MIDQARAQQYLDRAVDNVTREFPHMPLHVVTADSDRERHRTRHPAFYGSFDWHSAVHQHWAMVRLLRRWPDLERVRGAGDVLDDHLSEQALAAEAGYLAARPGFERPYGQAWLVRLHAEVAVSDLPGAAAYAAALRPCRDLAVTNLTAWFDMLAYPVRHGLHSNSAFALLLMLESARTNDDGALADLVAQHARRLYLHDRDAPRAYEPSGEDFLSPALTTAHLMSALLDPDRFVDWLDGYLPSLRDGSDLGNLDQIPVVTDPDDYRIGHLVGLMLTRAWNWRAVGGALVDDHPGRPRALLAGTAHLQAGLPMVLTSGYGGDHWLSTFALLAAGDAQG